MQNYIKGREEPKDEEE